ncbi:MAG: cyclic-AMP phosphodiesterase [Gammaproteobacteria bacterium]|nr:MAG: cyclic-AMP phosphodiesterase [Gammaproteobacteria bacterium]TND03242.1 MAG: cyclic-AMP phosphodiesterase [Gammaproteobacteria bacterium]
MKLRVLGCSGGVGAGLRTTSFLLDSDVLVDAGSGVGDLTLDEMASIRHIFVTHSHLDHVAFIPLFLDSIFDRIGTPVVLHGQRPTLVALKAHVFNGVMWPDFASLPHPDRPVLRYVEMKPGEIVVVGDKTIEMIRVNHAVAGAGYRVTGQHGVFAFSGDTTSNDTLWEALNRHDRLDLLIVETAFADEDEELGRLARHYTPRLLAEDLLKLRHDPDIYITHRKPGDEGKILEECRVALADRRVRGLAGNECFEL